MQDDCTPDELAAALAALAARTGARVAALRRASQRIHESLRRDADARAAEAVSEVSTADRADERAPRLREFARQRLRLLQCVEGGRRRGRGRTRSARRAGSRGGGDPGPARAPIRGLADSKVLLPEAARRARTRASRERALAWHVDVHRASRRSSASTSCRRRCSACARALAALLPVPARALIDGNRCRGRLCCPARAIVDGDALRALRSAPRRSSPRSRATGTCGTSTRQSRLRLRLAQGLFDAGAPRRAARLGPCPQHRRSFAPVRERSRCRSFDHFADISRRALRTAHLLRASGCGEVRLAQRRVQRRSCTAPPRPSACMPMALIVARTSGPQPLLFALKPSSPAASGARGRRRRAARDPVA